MSSRVFSFYFNLKTSSTFIILLRKKYIRHPATTPMGSSKHGDDDSSCGVRLAERRSLKKGLEAEVATDSRKTSITKPLEGEYAFK